MHTCKHTNEATAIQDGGILTTSHCHQCGDTSVTLSYRGQDFDVTGIADGVTAPQTLLRSLVASNRKQIAVLQADLAAAQSALDMVPLVVSGKGSRDIMWEAPEKVGFRMARCAEIGLHCRLANRDDLAAL